MDGSKVLVTGVSGYLGLHVAKALIERGHQVRGTIRGRSKESTVRNALGADDKQLTLEVCDLTSDDGWAEAFSNVDAVIHVASPFILSEPKDEQVYLRPAVEGTQRVMKFAKEASVKKAVVTSTYLTMAGHLESGTFGPKNFTPLESPGLNSYIRSKIAAEQALWDFVASSGSGMRVNTIHPGAILGPPLSSEGEGTSISTLRDMIRGSTPGIPPISVPMVDVRDAAQAHVAAMESDFTGQRYVVCQPESVGYIEVAKVLKAAGYSKVPGRELPKALIRGLAPFSRDIRAMKAFLDKSVTADISQTVQDLDWSPRPIRDTVLDSAEALS